MVESRSRQHRVYFALWPADAVRQQIASIARDWVERSGGDAVRTENFHATLAFIGSVSADTVQRLQDIAASVRSAPFEFSFDRIESWTTAKVLCLVATQPAARLMSLAASLRLSLLEQQVELSSQEFRPHVTLARRPTQRIDAAAGPILWPATDFALVESNPGPQGSEYRIIGRWRLRD
jgi:2'-5' RNA ligase